MTGQDVIDFIEKHNLQDADLMDDQLNFSIDPTEDCTDWLMYDFWEEDVSHFVDGEAITISYEEAEKIRKEWEEEE